MNSDLVFGLFIQIMLLSLFGALHKCFCFNLWCKDCVVFQMPVGAKCHSWKDMLLNWQGDHNWH